ncbi:GatB/YqeY domain-containing protein [Paraburkholderia aspalathi]|nr:GatB/YqeY domain-containing protein [Paraburkholderia aspalathi]MBK3780422.1 GatB/YqeY domain-containing protein [Paraburkholderia aspalathi]
MTQSTLLKRIQDDALTARKARDTDKGTFLTTLFSEAGRVGKDDGNRESTEDEVTKVIKKFLSNLEYSLTELDKHGVPADSDLRKQPHFERGLLEAYLPRQATQDDIRAAVAAAIAELAEVSMKQMGVVMGKLKAQFGENFDRTFASDLVKASLNAKA